MSSDPRILNVIKGDVLESLNGLGVCVVVDKAVDGNVTYDRYVDGRFKQRVGPARPGWLAEHWRVLDRDEATTWLVMQS